MVSNIFIIYESGLCLFSRDYERNIQKTDLISGLLSAFSSFARVLIGENVNFRISKTKLSSTMKKISQSFINRYHNYLNEGLFEPQLFRDFTKTVDQILTTRGVIKKGDLVTSSKESKSQLFFWGNI